MTQLTAVNKMAKEHISMRLTILSILFLALFLTTCARNQMIPESLNIRESGTEHRHANPNTHFDTRIYSSIVKRPKSYSLNLESVLFNETAISRKYKFVNVTASCANTHNPQHRYLISSKYLSVCTWKIIAPVYGRLRLHFNTFLTETCCDKLIIFDGPNSTFKTILVNNIN